MNEEDIIRAVKSATEVEVSSRTDDVVLEAARRKAAEIKSGATPRGTRPLHGRRMVQAIAVAAGILVVCGLTLVAAPGVMDTLLNYFKGPAGLNESAPAVKFERRYFKGQPGGPAGGHVGGTTAPLDMPYKAILFEYYPDNPFIDTGDESASVFAADVDTGSYTIARRFFRDGHIPMREAVRTEEFVNYFNYDYTPPSRETFSVHIEGAPSKFARYKTGYQLLRIGIRAKEIPADKRKDANLVFVVDVSASMAIGDRIRLVRKSLRRLLGALRPEDTVAVVAFGESAYTALSPTAVKNKDEIIGAVEMLVPAEAPDGTNLEAGMALAYETAAGMFDRKKINRVILCSDGYANMGKTGPFSILDEIQQEAARGIYLTTVGFGMGNYNDYLMEQMADNGDGQYFYIDTKEEVRRVFVKDLVGTLQVVAKDVKVSVDFNPDTVSRYRLIGYENRRIGDKDSSGADGGDIGAGQSMTALYEMKFQEAAEPGRVATLTIKYTDPDTGKTHELKKEIATKAFGDSFEKASTGFRLAACVAQFAGILRESYWAKESGFSDILPDIRKILEEREDDADVIELLNLVRRAGSSDPAVPTDGP